MVYLLIREIALIFLVSNSTKPLIVANIYEMPKIINNERTTQSLHQSTETMKNIMSLLSGGLAGMTAKVTPAYYFYLNINFMIFIWNKPLFHFCQ